MRATDKQLKRQSLDMLKNNWLVPVLVCLIAWLLADSGSSNSTEHVNYVYENGQFVKNVTKDSGGIMDIVNLVLAGPIYFGLSRFFLDMKREGITEFKTLFAGFPNFPKLFFTNLLVLVKIILWALLFIIPGIIAYYRYSMTYFILNDRPELTVSEAIQESGRLMDGRKADLFFLQLSFIGWFILSILTFGIGFLFLYPYYYGVKTCFYENLRKGYYSYYEEDAENADESGEIVLEKE